MAPILIERSQICDASWNEHIRKSLQCVIYAQTFYLDHVCESWKALVWPSVNDPEIIMPLPIRRKFGFPIVYQPIFCQYLGIFSIHPLSDFELEAFIRFVSHQFSYISAYYFNPENSIRISSLQTAFADLTFSENHTQWLQIDRGHAQLLSGYSKDRKRNLKRSRNFSWETQRSADIMPLIKLFQENQTGRIPGGVDPTTFLRLEALFKTLAGRGQAEICYALSDAQIHAGIMLVKFGRRVIYLFNAADQKGRSGNARTLMLDEYFRHKSSDAVMFDFESPDVQSIVSFYNSFGSSPVSFYSICKNDLPFPIKQIQRWRKGFFKTIQDPS